MTDLVETAPVTPDVGFLPSQPPRTARWLDGCREHWRPESGAVPGPQLGHNFTDARRLCRTTRTPKYAHCIGSALSDRYLVLEPTLGRNIVALDDVKSWYALGVRDGRPRSRVDCPRAALLGCAARPAPRALVRGKQRSVHASASARWPKQTSARTSSLVSSGTEANLP